LNNFYIYIDKCGGGQKIFGTFKVYNPTLIQYIIFWHQEGVDVKNNIINTLKNPNLQHLLRGDITLFEDDQYILLEIPFTFSIDKGKQGSLNQHKSVNHQSGDNRQEDSKWQELAPTEIKLQIQSCKTYSETVVNILTTSIKDLTHLQTFYLLQVGSKEDYWFETRIDVSRLRMVDGSQERSLREISSKTRLEMLSDTIGGFSKLLANKISGAKSNTMVIGFSSKTKEASLDDYPTIFMLVVTVEDIYNTPTHEMMEIEANYNLTTRSFSTNFGKLLLYHSKLMALHNIGYTEANARATDLKTKAQRMQREINTLIRESQKIASESTIWYLADTMQKKGPGYDEKLLYNASINFSNITELLQTVSNAIHLSKENSYYLTKAGTSLGLENVTNPMTLEKTEHISLHDEFRRFSEQVTHSFESLKLEIEGTQLSLVNTVDVLKTFLEGKQRQSSTSSSRILGLLTVVFACFVFLDMISNYFVYYLESERSLEIMSELAFFIIVTLSIPSIMFVALYFLVLKKMY
jgi:hypothetical protein